MGLLIFALLSYWEITLYIYGTKTVNILSICSLNSFQFYADCNSNGKDDAWRTKIGNEAKVRNERYHGEYEFVYSNVTVNKIKVGTHMKNKLQKITRCAHSF